MGSNGRKIKLTIRWLWCRSKLIGAGVQDCRSGFGVHGGLQMFSAGVRRVLIASFALVAAGLLIIHLAGCNTVKGVGRDIEAVGQGGQDMIDGKTR